MTDTATEPTTQDTLPDVGHTLAAGEGTPPAEAPMTFTEEQVKAEVAKAKQDWSREEGRSRKKQDDSRVSNLEAQIAAMQRERDEQERAKYEGNPDALATWEQKRALREERAKLLQGKQELEAEREANKADLEEAKQLRQHKKAVEIAKGYEGVDADDLVTLTDGSPERMEALAKRLGKVKAVKEPKLTSDNKPDSGIGSGASTKLGDLSPKERMRATEKRLLSTMK